MRFATLSAQAAAATLALIGVVLPVNTLAAQNATDPNLWLEEVEGERALQWAEERNAETRATLMAHPRYRQIFDQTMEILTSSDRIATPTIMAGQVYNFWTDATHPRGILRRTDWDDYLAGDPAWETVIDIDALSDTDGVPWAFKSLFGSAMLCHAPTNRRCLVFLSPGGSDASEVREFDLVEKRFVSGGFTLPAAKVSAAWVDGDHILVATSGEGEPVTTSGYAATVRLWERGTPFSAASEVFAIDDGDMAVAVGSMETHRGSEPTIARLKTIFTADTHLVRDGRLARLDIPDDATTAVSGNHLIVQLVSEWTVGGRSYPEGSVVSTDLEALVAGRTDIEVVLEPGPRSSINAISTTKDHVLITMLTDVQGQLLRFTHGDAGWTREAIETPSMGSVAIVANGTSSEHNRFFFSFSSFTQPTTLYFADEDGSVREVASLPHEFAADGVITEQFYATSADGTEVPYFVVRHEDAPLDGSNPTLQTAYGGFQISRTPAYLGSTGKNWVEAGGVYVLANIRGGGEFGPAWWRAALKENRQRAYDDFIAVSEDLIARGITSPEHLGIMGGSNGGLLVGVAMTQRPDLYGAVVSAVPLLDMKRYHFLLAGASWMAEYGNPDVPEEWSYISEYSPYQNLRPDVEYPEAFIWTTTRDDRVHPGHARKMTELFRQQGHPVLYFENTEGGHGSGVTPEQQAEVEALQFSYLFRRLSGRSAA